jgi:signal transduction histidine kinase
VEAHRKERATAVLRERLRNTERLRPALLDGLRELADKADSESDVSVIESGARTLLGRTRCEVLALTAPVPEAVPHGLEPEERQHLTVMRSAAQPWTALAAGALGAGLAVESLESLPLGAPDWVAVCAGFVVTAPLALLAWRPLAGVVLTWIAVTLFSNTVAPLDGSLSGSGIGLVLAFSVAVLSSRATAVAGLLVCWLAAGLQAADPLGVSLILLAAWLGGIAVNEVTDLVEQSREHNRRLALRARFEAQHAVVEERMRIAREIHDVLGHSLTVIAIQAGAARRLEATDPERAAKARHTLGAAAREGLRILEEGGPRTPDLEATLERTRSAGLTVEAEVDDLTGIDAATLHAAERVVQESLTNVLRHAPGSRASVRIRRTADGLDVVVTNTAPTSPGPGPGSNRGLAGMRERVTTLAGRVTWGHDAQGGFTVDAHLPLSRLMVSR